MCTSELGAAAKLQGEFSKRGIQLVALSCNDLDSHKQVGSAPCPALLAAGSMGRRCTCTAHIKAHRHVSMHAS